MTEGPQRFSLCASGTLEFDCNTNGTPDGLDIAAGTSEDCTGNGIPDECEPDCQPNGTADSCDISAGMSADCTSNGVPDECEPDCQPNEAADSCDIYGGTSADCNGNGRPDECDIAAGTSLDDLPPAHDGIPDECQEDCNDNQVPDSDDIGEGESVDCNSNAVPDECDIAEGSSRDDLPLAGDGVPDECQVDCNDNDIVDDVDVAVGTSLDCNTNGIPDECDLMFCASLDCNTNAIPDECDIGAGTSEDVDGNGVPDECASPPVITAIASVAEHAQSGTFPGGEIELCISQESGGIEPRDQGDGDVFLRVTFDKDMDAASLADNVRITPDISPVTATVSLSALGDHIVEITFSDAMPDGSYRVDLAGMRALDGGTVTGACASFPVCFVLGDVNCDGQQSWLDVMLTFVAGHFGTVLGDDGADPRADRNRNGQIDGADIESDPAVLDSPALPVACACPCNPWNSCAEPMDWDADGDVDLADFAGFQECMLDESSNGCLETFDRAADCGTIGLADFAVFLRQIRGPGGGFGSWMMGGGEGAIISAPLDEPGSWTYDDAEVEIELRPAGRRRPVTTLTAGTTYELHYSAGHSRCNMYTLFVAADSSEAGIAAADPPSAGDWAETGNFAFLDMGGEPAVQMIFDDFGTDMEQYAGAQGHLCSITTRASGELTLELQLVSYDPVELSCVLMVEQVQYTVAESP